MGLYHFFQRALDRGTQATRFNATWVAIIGVPAHFFFYFVFRYGYDLEENVYIRLLAVLVSIAAPFALKLPATVLPYLWHLGVIIVLPFIFTANLLITNFHEAWLYWEIFMLFLMVAVVPNWLVFMLDILIGVGAAFVFYLTFYSHIVLAPDFSIPLYSMVVIGSILTGHVFGYSNLQGTIAQEKNKLLQSLAGSIAHEMRNPLNQIAHNLSALKTDLPDYHPQKESVSISSSLLAKSYESLTQGQQAVSRGSQLITMILDQMNEKPIDKDHFANIQASKIVNAAVMEYGYKSHAERQRISLDVSDDFVLRADETMMIFVLFNLLKNALYYLEENEDSQIIIRLQQGRERNLIFFRDTGPGMDATELANVFEGFYTSGKVSGTGLGLAYCKRVMNSVEGDILCDSVKTQFTEFKLSFPLVSQESIKADYQKFLNRMCACFQGKRALLVDGEGHNFEMFSDSLGPLDIQIDVVADGESAVLKLESQAYDVIVMTLDLPILSGHKLVERLREIENARFGNTSTSLTIKNAVILALTSEPSYLLEGYIKKAGMQGVIDTASSQFDLINTLQSAVEAHRCSLGLSGIHAVLLDDDAISVELMSLPLLEAGMRVTTSSSAGEVLQILENERCDLLVTDIQMPEMSGFDLTAKIRSHSLSRIAELPVIGLSGNSSSESRAQSEMVDMNYYLIKPVANDELLRAIGKSLSMGRSFSR